MMHTGAKLNKTQTIPFYLICIDFISLQFFVFFFLILICIKLDLKLKIIMWVVHVIQLYMYIVQIQKTVEMFFFF